MSSKPDEMSSVIDVAASLGLEAKRGVRIFSEMKGEANYNIIIRPPFDKFPSARERGEVDELQRSPDILQIREASSFFTR
jgi:hypothetical protein